MACKPVVLISIGISLLVVGILIAILGPVVAPPQLDSLFTKGVDQYVVIDSKDADGYGPWSGKQDKTSAFYYVAWMWNLTNWGDVRSSGATPNYTSVGPYYFRRYKHAENVTFPDNGNQIRFQMPENIEFQRTMSVGDESDLIVNINPAYIAILSQFYSISGQLGTEQNMVAASGSGFLPLALDWYMRFESPSFNTLYSAYRFNQIFSSLFKERVAATNATYFMSQWANATTPETKDWEGLLVSQNGNPSGISTASAKILFRDSGCSFLAPNTTDCALLWYSAQIDQTARAQLMSEFELTEANLDAIVNWMNKLFTPAYVHPIIFPEFGVANVSELGWKQFFGGSVLGKTLYGNESACHSVNENFPTEGHNIYAPVEIQCISDSTGVANPTNSVRAREIVTNPETGLLNIDVFQNLLKNHTLNERIHMTPAEADFYYGYAVSFSAQSIGYLQYINGPSGGLMPARSVRSWLWDCQDLLLDILQPGHPSCSILANNGTYFPPSTIYSGKSNISLANVYVNWRSDNNTVYGWQHPINVSGHTTMGQFQPGLEAGEAIWAFDDDLVRPLRLNNFANNDSVKDIAVRSYMLDFQQALGANELYFSPIAGLTNMSSMKFGTPAFLSLWDMYGVDSQITNRVIGMNKTIDEHSATTILKIEPITGNTISAEERIQVNIYVNTTNPPDTPMFDYSFGNSMTPLGVYYPSVKIMKYGVVGDGDADMIKSKLSLVPTLKRTIFYISVIGGPLLFLLGMFMLIVGIRRRNHGYELIN